MENNKITTEEASENLKDLLGVYRPEMEESIRLGIRVLDATPEIKEIPKDYKYDTETNEFEVYRHIYTGDEIHILKEPQLYRYDEPMLPVKKIKAIIDSFAETMNHKAANRTASMYADYEMGVIDTYMEVIRQLYGLIKGKYEEKSYVDNV